MNELNKGALLGGAATFSVMLFIIVLWWATHPPVECVPKDAMVFSPVPPVVNVMEEKYVPEPKGIYNGLKDNSLKYIPDFDEWFDTYKDVIYAPGNETK